jgi:hypothetical protein
VLARIFFLDQKDPRHLNPRLYLSRKAAIMRAAAAVGAAPITPQRLTQTNNALSQIAHWKGLP